MQAIRLTKRILEEGSTPAQIHGKMSQMSSWAGESFKHENSGALGRDASSCDAEQCRCRVCT